MKKVTAAILLLVMMVSMSATVFAEETPTVSGNSQEVLASYEKVSQDRTVISVDISWEQMSFTYKGATMPTWDANEHRYEGEEAEAGWLEGNGIITICNNSNVILKANISYNKEDKFSGVDMKFTDTAPYLGSAYTDDRLNDDGEVIGTPCEVTIKAIPTGALDEETGNNTKIGTITISINPDVNESDILDELGVAVSEHAVADTTGLSRGDVYITSGAANELYTLLDEASVAYVDAKTPAEKNVVLNKVLKAYYDALNIMQ